MRAIVYHCYGGPEVLELVKVAKPGVADDEVLVQVKAAGVNPLDWHYMRGSPYLMRAVSGIGSPQDPRLGVDFAGIVVSVGKKVTRFKTGDEVFGGASGAFAEYLSIKETRGLVLKPSRLSFKQAAAVPIAAVTALQALRDEGQLKSGQKVLINGASGGVGTFAVQIAKSFGAEVTGVCSTRNVAMVQGLGADHIINYKQQDFVKSGEQYDLILDNVGNRSLSELRKVLKPEGILVMVGGSKGNWVGPFKNNIGALVLSPFVSQKLLGFLAEINQQDLTVLADLMQAGDITPVIDRQFSLSQASEAIQYSESGRAQGKIIIGM
ncbi:MAG: NAD(P)-dependent alcohol dehydrogenase [Gammaproteobacteria bacterium]|nr:NAD(P)-dependent alcohol dehydrogenase [Gammaproteobacteria bacterium]